MRISLLVMALMVGACAPRPSYQGPETLPPVATPQVQEETQ